MSLHSTLEDLLSENSETSIYNTSKQLLVTVSLSSSTCLQIIYNNESDTSPDNICEAKLIKLGFERQEITLDDDEIEILSNKGYF